MKVWLNGNLISEGDAKVPLLSHGFSRASAIFEVFRVHAGPEGPMAFRMDEHLKRLMKSAELLGMETAYSVEEIEEAIKTTVKVNGVGRGLIKILSYWGEVAVTKLVLDSKLDLAIFATPEARELELDISEPISVCLSKWRKLHPETVPVEAKASANYLNAYLARRDAYERGFDAGIMLNTEGFLAEGSRESVFMVKEKLLQVPPLGSVLSSITRASILEAVPMLGVICRERNISSDELYKADEIFTARTSMKVAPVSRFENKHLEAPGPITRKVMRLMDDIIHFRDDRFLDWFQPLT